MGGIHIVIDQAPQVASGLPAVGSWLVNKVLPPLLAGAAIALLGSWLLARLNEFHKGKREHLVKTVEYLLSTLSELQNLSAQYWAAAPSPTTIAMEPAIEYKLQLVNMLQDMCVREMAPERASAVSALMLRLMEQTCPFQFGDPARTAEPDRGMVIAGLISRIAQDVIEGRREIVHVGPARQFQAWMDKPVSKV